MNAVIGMLEKLLENADGIYIAKGAKTYLLNSSELPVDEGIRFVKHRLDELRGPKVDQ